ncbi:MAG: outer membrane beta-barrel protein [Gammaproteobacteria bacterium]|nr:outer membrane beta-barrel protein [Gammaproteobacteria bacterium]
MKKIILISTVVACATFSTLASAARVGGYAGLGVGYGLIKTPGHQAFNITGGGTSSRKRGGISGRGFAGINISPCLGFEIGYAYYKPSYYKGTTAAGYSLMQYNVRTYDIEAKAYLPIPRTGFDAYALAGCARVAETVRYPNSNVPLSGAIASPTNVGGNTYAYKTRPLYGLGVMYTFNPCISANIEGTQIRRLGNFQNSANAIPFVNLITANVAYHFG